MEWHRFGIILSNKVFMQTMSISFQPKGRCGLSGSGTQKRGEGALGNRVFSSLSAKTSIHGLRLSVRIGWAGIEKSGGVAVWRSGKENRV